MLGKWQSLSRSLFVDCHTVCLFVCLFFRRLFAYTNICKCSDRLIESVIFLFICFCLLFVCVQFIYLPVYISGCLPIYLSLWLSVCFPKFTPWLKLVARWHKDLSFGVRHPPKPEWSSIFHFSLLYLGIHWLICPINIRKNGHKIPPVNIPARSILFISQLDPLAANSA